MNAETLVARIKELRDNYQAGQAQLHKLEAQQRELQQTLLRISGAIQVLEELQQELQQESQQDARQSAVPRPSANGHA
jgi:predicted nuclease with TOPRIM domain